ncbi:hypothetical protein R6Z07F_004431 [Ovis aries]
MSSSSWHGSFSRVSSSGLRSLRVTVHAGSARPGEGGPRRQPGPRAPPPRARGPARPGGGSGAPRGRCARRASARSQKSEGSGVRPRRAERRGAEPARPGRGARPRPRQRQRRRPRVVPAPAPAPGSRGPDPAAAAAARPGGHLLRRVGRASALPGPRRPRPADREPPALRGAARAPLQVTPQKTHEEGSRCAGGKLAVDEVSVPPGARGRGRGEEWTVANSSASDFQRSTQAQSGYEPYRDSGPCTGDLNPCRDTFQAVRDRGGARACPRAGLRPPGWAPTEQLGLPTARLHAHSEPWERGAARLTLTAVLSLAALSGCASWAGARRPGAWSGRNAAGRRASVQSTETASSCLCASGSAGPRGSPSLAFLWSL